MTRWELFERVFGRFALFFERFLTDRFVYRIAERLGLVDHLIKDPVYRKMVGDMSRSLTRTKAAFTASIFDDPTDQKWSSANSPNYPALTRKFYGARRDD